MRIVHLCRVAPPSRGGMEAVVEGLSGWQAAQGHSVSVVTVEPGEVAHTAAGVPIVRLPRRGPRRWPFAAGLARALQGADVVHVHGIDGLADQALTVRPPGARVGLSTHGGYLHGRRSWALKQIWLRTLTRVSLARADAVWFTSVSDARALAPAGLLGEVVPNGLALDGLLGLARRPEPGRFLVPGRVDRHKGIDDLLRVLSRLRGRDARPFELRIVGRLADAGLGEALLRQAADLGLGDRVRLLGEVSEADLRAELAACELAFFPSRHEGFGLALVEAMAAGVAPIARPIPAFTERVTHGVSGELVPVDEALVDHLLRVRGADRSALDRAARDAARGFAWDRVGPLWDAAYARLLEGP